MLGVLPLFSSLAISVSWSTAFTPTQLRRPRTGLINAAGHPLKGKWSQWVTCI